MLFKIIGGFFLILGVFFFIRGVSYIIDIHRSLNWPSVDGIIVKSALASESLTQHGDITSTGYGTRPDSMDSAVVEYHYKVNGDVYAGTRISIGDHVGKARTEEILSKYPVGTKVQVYYDHNDVTEATLETRQSIYNYMGVGIGLLLVLLSIYFFK